MAANIPSGLRSRSDLTAGWRNPHTAAPSGAAVSFCENDQIGSRSEPSHKTRPTRKNLFLFSFSDTPIPYLSILFITASLRHGVEAGTALARPVTSQRSTDGA